MTRKKPLFSNPFRPGTGHSPPHLAGRAREQAEFTRLLNQDVVLENMVLTGLRGVGKTVLLDSFKPAAQQAGWAWAGAEVSESASVTEKTLAVRVLTDLAVITSSYVMGRSARVKTGFSGRVQKHEHRMTYPVLEAVFEQTPGLAADKLKGVLKFVWEHKPEKTPRGIVFAYDEAQSFSDHAEKGEYPLSLLLNVFQSLQKQEIPCLLILAGLPTLHPKLVETRTYSERMFRVVFLDKLSREESREAVTEPLKAPGCPVKFSGPAVERICAQSGGYPYFIQFICREMFDVAVSRGGKAPAPNGEIIKKLDENFFAGRWAAATDRQRDLLALAAGLDGADEEFTISAASKASMAVLGTHLTNSYIGQMLNKLSRQGLIYKNRRGKYAFALPMLGGFIRRQKLPEA